MELYSGVLRIISKLFIHIHVQVSPTSTNGDPIVGIQTTITAITSNTITINVGAGGGAGTGAVVNATVGVGGTLTFTVANGGTGYVQPQINIPQPSYENLEVVGVSRLGQGATTETVKLTYKCRCRSNKHSWYRINTT